MDLGGAKTDAEMIGGAGHTGTVGFSAQELTLLDPPNNMFGILASASMSLSICAILATHASILAIHALIHAIHVSMIASLGSMTATHAAKLKEVAAQLKEAAALLLNQPEKFGMSARANGSPKSGMLPAADGRTSVILAGQE